MACYANSFFVLSTNIDYVVYIIKNDTDQRYDRGQLYAFDRGALLYLS